MTDARCALSRAFYLFSFFPFIPQRSAPDLSTLEATRKSLEPRYFPVGTAVGSLERIVRTTVNLAISFSDLSRSVGRARFAIWRSGWPSGQHEALKSRLPTRAGPLELVHLQWSIGGSLAKKSNYCQLAANYSDSFGEHLIWQRDADDM